jgi:hypothetical protein
MSTCLQSMIQLHPKSATIPSTGHSSKMLLEQWMAVISTAHLLQLSDQFVETERTLCHKIAYFVAILVSISSIPSPDGKVLPQMHMSMEMPESMIYIFLLASTTLLMQVIHTVQNSWYLIAMHDIILLNGVMHIPGENLCLSRYNLIAEIIIGHIIKKSCLIFTMLLHGMSLNEFLVFSNVISAFSLLYQSTGLIFKHGFHQHYVQFTTSIASMIYQTQKHFLMMRLILMTTMTLTMDLIPQMMQKRETMQV